MYIIKCSAQVHMAKMHKLASASPPYERVPNILQYTFNNLFSIYLYNGSDTTKHIKVCPTFYFATHNVNTIINSY